MNTGLMYSLIATVIAVGGVLVGIGIIKGKITHTSETLAAQGEEIKTFAHKEDLAAVMTRGDEHLESAIKRSDDILEMIIKRADEDRQSGAGQYREFHTLLRGHAERISALETTQTVVMKTLDEMKHDIKGGFRDLQDELKELRKHP